MPGMCASNNSLLDPENPEFGVGYEMESHTNETAWISGRYLGWKTANPCITLIDTPGVGDSLVSIKIQFGQNFINFLPRDEIVNMHL